MLEPVSILVLDGHAPLRECIGEVLQRAGCRVHLAGTGEQALEVARSVRLDASFSDVWLPDRDGFTTARELRAVHAELPLVFVTASGSEQDRRRGEELGCFAWLVKPVRPPELLDVLERLTRGNPN